MENKNELSMLHEIEEWVTAAKKDKIRLMSNKEDTSELDRKIGALSLIKSELIKKNKSNEYHLTEEEELRLFSDMANTREKNIEVYEKQGRQDLIEGEKAELDILNHFLPKMPPKDELRAFIIAKIDEHLSQQTEGYKLSMRDMGKVKPMVKETYWRTDDGLIKDVLMERINSQ